MSKPEKSKSKEDNPRDSKGRFIKSISRIPPDLFGGNNTPSTNQDQRYIRREVSEGQRFVIDITESQLAAKIQFETTKEQIPGCFQESKLVEEQLISTENFTNFLKTHFNIL